MMSRIFKISKFKIFKVRFGHLTNNSIAKYSENFDN